MAVPKLVFPVVLNEAQAKLVERAKRLAADGTPVVQSRSKFMRDAILAEAERRLARAVKKAS